jgi:hypothetical protein
MYKWRVVHALAEIILVMDDEASLTVPSLREHGLSTRFAFSTTARKRPTIPKVKAPTARLDDQT